MLKPKAVLKEIEHTITKLITQSRDNLLKYYIANARYIGLDGDFFESHFFV
jgi:hypothetical protein